MELSKIEKLINSGYLTKIDELDKLVEMTEEEMVNNGYLTHTNTLDRKSTRLNSSHYSASRMPSSA